MIATLNDFLWGQVLVVLLIGVGILFTVSSRFVQFRYFSRMWRILRGGMHHEKGHVSSFQALVVSVAGRVGSGNIAGVAVAITLGGPGAVFWMWLIGLMGMATSFFECSLAQLFKRREPDGTYRGGPAYYLSHGIGQKGLAAVYSVLLLVTFGLCFNALQSYVVATSVEASFGVPAWATGLLMVALLGATIFGGIKRIAVVAEIVVPVMAVGYFLAAIIVIGLNISEVPGVLMHIVESAFGLDSAVGGGIGVGGHAGHQARPVLQRGWPGQRPQRGRRGACAASGQPGHSAGLQRIYRHPHHVHLHRRYHPAVGCLPARGGRRIRGGPDPERAGRSCGRLGRRFCQCGAGAVCLQLHDVQLLPR